MRFGSRAEDFSMKTKLTKMRWICLRIPSTTPARKTNPELRWRIWIRLMRCFEVSSQESSSSNPSLRDRRTVECKLRFLNKMILIRRAFKRPNLTQIVSIESKFSGKLLKVRPAKTDQPVALSTLKRKQKKSRKNKRQNFRRMPKKSAPGFLGTSPKQKRWPNTKTLMCRNALNIVSVSFCSNRTNLRSVWVTF